MHHQQQPESPHPPMRSFAIRDASATDLDQLTALEAASFDSDRLSTRSLRRLSAAPSATLRVATKRSEVVGYHLLLFRAGSTVGRLYSIAVAESARGDGIGEALLADAERIARRRGSSWLRLEVHQRNIPAIRLYEHAGYRAFGRHRHYYADKADALRYEKPLGHRGKKRSADDDEDRSPQSHAFAKPQPAEAMTAKSDLVALRSGALPARPRYPIPFPLLQPPS